jgi:EmrB/QacA subfamily drug resistance transporter
MTAQTPSTTPVFEADPRRWKALAVLALVQFMLVLDVTVVNVALPHIQSDLNFSPSGLTWVVDGYVLMAGGLLLLGGRLSDIYGRRRLFLIGVALFGAASLTCGLAASSGMLVASRFVQGTGEAMAAPAALGLVALLFPDPKERTKALGIWGGIAGLGGTSGTILSGLITNIGPSTWRWIFLVNIPVAVAALIIVPRLVNESRMDRDASGHRPDIWGAVTVTGGLIALVYGLLRAAEVPWGSSSVVISLIGAGLLLVGFVIVESRVSDPLIPLRFFNNRTRVTANGVTLFFTSAFFSYFFLQTLYLQQVLGWSALKTGMSYIPFGVGITLGIGVSTGLLPKLGTKAVMTVGFFLGAIGLFLVSGISVDSTYAADILPGMLFLAFGSGLCFPGFINASLHGVSGQDASLASGVQNAVQQVGGAVGLAVLYTIALHHFHNVFNGTNRAEAAVAGYSLSFKVAAVILALGGLAVVIFMQRVQPAVDPMLAEVGVGHEDNEKAGERAATPSA